MKDYTHIPWQTLDEWNQIFFSIQAIDNLYGDKLNNIRELAINIRQKYKQISDAIEMVCSHTCVDCMDICCKRATIWFDLKDVLYIYFGTKTFPEFQIYKKEKEKSEKSCCHFSPKGCALERTKRPFVCTWYFCSDQKKYLASHHRKINSDFDLIFMEIKNFRNQIEEEFIQISSGY
ncbi:MAG: hypothetical protein GY699_05955 [Desulfobacteraceae bacterium]|nr:hypothetical protein [Desulfobacteraceae bacterium]